MRIGIDIDDTICDTWEYVKPLFKQNFNLDDLELEKNNYSRVLNCTLEEYYDFYKKNIDPIMLDIPIKKDAAKYINKLKKDGHEIYFITARGDFDMLNPYEKTKIYLEKNNIKYDKLLTNSLEKDKAVLKNKIDIFIDDSIKHCMSISKLGIPVLMFETSYNKQTEFRKVKSWKEIYDIINRKEW